MAFDSNGAVHRRLRVRDDARGADVKLVQVAINQRGAARGFPKVAVDGEYGPETDRVGRAVAQALGIRTWFDGLGERVQRKLRQPDTRTPAEKHRADKWRKQQARKPLRVKAYDAAVKDLGILEQGGNNHGPAVEAIIRENGGVVGEPWCGDAVAHWYREAGSKVVQRGWASTIWLLASLLPVKSPAKGHVVVYDFGTSGAKHTGVFERWAPERGPGWFFAIEGNTGKDGAVSDSTGGGDGVHRRLRHTSQVAGFRRVLK